MDGVKAAEWVVNEPCVMNQFMQQICQDGLSSLNATRHDAKEEIAEWYAMRLSTARKHNSVSPQPAVDSAVPSVHLMQHGVEGHDEMHVDKLELPARPPSPGKTSTKSMPYQPPTPHRSPTNSAVANFVSAREDAAAARSQHDVIMHETVSDGVDNEMACRGDDLKSMSTSRDKSTVAGAGTHPPSQPLGAGGETASASSPPVATTQDNRQDDLADDGDKTPSSSPSPAKPPLRKSSITFSALPAREPLTGKKSIGDRQSSLSQLAHYRPPDKHLSIFTGSQINGHTSALDKPRYPGALTSTPQDPHCPELLDNLRKGNGNGMDIDDWIAPVANELSGSTPQNLKPRRSSSVPAVRETTIGNLGVGMEDVPPPGTSISATPDCSRAKSVSALGHRSPARKKALAAPEPSQKNASCVFQSEQQRDAGSNSPGWSPSPPVKPPVGPLRSNFTTLLNSAANAFPGNATNATVPHAQATASSTSSPGKLSKCPSDGPVNPVLPPVRRPAPTSDGSVPKNPAAARSEPEDNGLKPGPGPAAGIGILKVVKEQQLDKDSVAGQRKGAISRCGLYNTLDPQNRVMQPVSTKSHISVQVKSKRLHAPVTQSSNALHGTLPVDASTAAIQSAAMSAGNGTVSKSNCISKAPSTRPIALYQAGKAKETVEPRARQKDQRRVELKRAEPISRAPPAPPAKRTANGQTSAAEANRPEWLRTQSASRQNNAPSQSLKAKPIISGSHHGSGLGGARPTSRLDTVPNNHPIERSKRRVADDDLSVTHQPSAKRLQTTASDDDDDEDELKPTADRPSIMAPPMRPSNVRVLQPEPKHTMSAVDKTKGDNPFSHGYKPATIRLPSHRTQMDPLKKTVKAQYHAGHSEAGIRHPNDLATVSTAKITFAETAGPSSAAGLSSSTLKTPARAVAIASKNQEFRTPELPEIGTDDDEDSDDEKNYFDHPGWVDSPFLRKQLVDQQELDPLDIFGPIPEVKMAEIFSKQRHRKWSDSDPWGNDKLTEKETTEAQAACRKIQEEGGWTHTYKGGESGTKTGSL